MPRDSQIFSKLKPTGLSSVELNPISQQFDIGKQVGSAGPELIWKIYDAVKKSEKKEASVFIFDKRVADKLHKPKRKETITEILRFSVRQLDRFKHPKLLTLYHPIEESSDTLAFATEPVFGSLANVLGCLEDRIPQNLPITIREYSFLPIEIRYGLLQLTEGLSFLHYSCKLIHRNVCPQSIIINKRGTWKLAGLEFTEKCDETGTTNAVPCQPFTSKLPKMGQPDLDFTAPEIQNSSTCSPYSDMFSLGLLICAIFNNGRSLIEANLSSSNYSKQLDLLEQNLHELLDRVPHHLQEPLQILLNLNPRKRPNAQNFSMIKYFNDPSIHALQYLDVIQMKDSTHKSHFYHSLKGVLPNIPRKLWYQHVLPSLQSELQSPEVLAAALQPLLFIIEESTADEYQTLILPMFRSIFGMPKSVQATVTLLENLDTIMKKTSKTDIKADVLPMMYAAFDSATPQIQLAAHHALAQVADYLEENAVRKMVLPRAKQVFDNHSGTKMQANALICIEKVLDKLEKTDILDEVLPMLNKAKLQDPAILMPVVTSSSPDSNLLRVQAALPGRRHSDNTIQPPRILVAPSSPESGLSRGSSAGSLQMRRHSSASPYENHDIKYQFVAPKPILTTNLGVNSLGSRRSSRRYSATALYNSIGGGGLSSAGSSTSLLKQIGTGVQQLFSSK
ncbi:SCY1-like protein 2 [Limulus polyphemus]|uniref:SCY1-like protein 2 n=1 Tax=Limulus polyphemus TaxID=6850 RepID=A0ABM1SXW7_LIMPO|nr:SCY1-like protein 2 [Limulus polyphemus]